MLCQVICRGSVLGIVFLVQTSTADFKWLVPSILGIMGLVSSVLVYHLPDRSTSPLLNTISNIKRLQITTIEKTIQKVTIDNKSWNQWFFVRQCKNHSWVVWFSLPRANQYYFSVLHTYLNRLNMIAFQLFCVDDWISALINDTINCVRIAFKYLFIWSFYGTKITLALRQFPLVEHYSKHQHVDGVYAVGLVASSTILCHIRPTLLEIF